MLLKCLRQSDKRFEEHLQKNGSEHIKLNNSLEDGFKKVWQALGDTDSRVQKNCEDLVENAIKSALDFDKAGAFQKQTLAVIDRHLVDSVRKETSRAFGAISKLGSDLDTKIDLPVHF